MKLSEGLNLLRRIGVTEEHLLIVFNKIDINSSKAEETVKQLEISKEVEWILISAKDRTNLNELLKAHSWSPAEFLARLRWVSNEIVHLCRSEVLCFHFHENLPTLPVSANLIRTGSFPIQTPWYSSWKYCPAWPAG